MKYDTRLIASVLILCCASPSFAAGGHGSSGGNLKNVVDPVSVVTVSGQKSYGNYCREDWKGAAPTPQYRWERGRSSCRNAGSAGAAPVDELDKLCMEHNNPPCTIWGYAAVDTDKSMIQKLQAEKLFVKGEQASKGCLGSAAGAAQVLPAPAAAAATQAETAAVLRSHKAGSPGESASKQRAKGMTSLGGGNGTVGIAQSPEPVQDTRSSPECMKLALKMSYVNTAIDGYTARHCSSSAGKGDASLCK